MTSLVPYGSSDEDEEAAATKDGTTLPRQKSSRKKLEAFDESRNENIKRAKVHTSLGIAASKPIKGDWLCYAFVPVSQQSEVYSIIKEASSLLTSRYSQVEAVSHPHISLTKPILVRIHEKEVLLSRSQEAVLEFGKSCQASRITLAFSSFTCLPSEDDSKTFWAVEIGLGWQELRSLTSSFNDKLASLNARKYFEEARYHSSFAWMPSESTNKKNSSAISDVLETTFGERLRACSPQFIDKIGIATGSQAQYIDLKGTTSTSSTLQ